MLWPHKLENFSQVFSAFLKSTFNLEYFEKKDDRQSFCISAITDSENVIREMSEKSHFTRPFDKQHGQR